ncbi:MAG: diheme cytochrome c-553 [Bacteroidota bacterium]
MKKSVLIIVAITASISFAVIACNNTSAKSESAVIISQDSMIKRGSYLVNAIGCDDCHSPKKLGPNGLNWIWNIAWWLPCQYAIGKPNTSVMKDGFMLFAMDLTSAVGPWGQSYSANISSDETGIGNWSEEQFLVAIREGKSKGLKEARPLLPPMPWTVYRNMSDTDLKSIFAYLKTTKPVHNVVPGPKSMKEL